jgi:enoyl-CoA hydratase
MSDRSKVRHFYRFLVYSHPDYRISGRSAAVEYIELVSEGAVTHMRLNRPPVNAIDLDLIHEAGEALDAIENDSSVAAVVISGTGESFSAGLDLKAVPLYSRDEQRDLIESVNNVISRIYGFPVPTVAAVNGHAVAGGFILAISCDYRVGADGPYALGVTEVRAGIPFPVSTMEVLKAELRPDAARRMILTGLNTGPSEAVQAGALDELTRPEDVLPRALEMASSMGTLPRMGFQRIKMQLRGEVIGRMRKVMAEGDPLIDSWITDESVGGAASLLDRRSPPGGSTGP